KLTTLTIRRSNFRSFTSFRMTDHVILNRAKNLCLCDSCTRGDSLKGQQTKFDMIRVDWIVSEQSFYWRYHAYYTWSTKPDRRNLWRIDARMGHAGRSRSVFQPGRNRSGRFQVPGAPCGPCDRRRSNPTHSPHDERRDRPNPRDDVVG